jgi:hypothetical protein
MPDQPYNVEPPPPPNPNATTEQPFVPSPPGGVNQAPSTLDNLLPTSILYFGQRFRYLTDKGRRSAPIAAPPPTPGESTSQPTQAFWRCHAGRTQKWIYAICVAAATGNLQLPHPDTQNDNEVLMEEEVIPFTPDNFLDGVQLQAALCIYRYELQTPLAAGVDTFDMGASPFDKTLAADNILTAEQFNQLFSQASAGNYTGPPITF